MKIKTKVRYHFTPLRMVIIKNIQQINAGEDMEKNAPHNFGGNVIWCSHYGEQF